MTGDRLDPGTLIATAERVAELSLGLAKQSTDPKAASEVQSEVAILKTQLQQARSGDREYREEIVTCPDCGASVGVKLGTITGDSAMPRCSSCDARFHAHRSSDGSVFTNPLGSPARTVNATCPGCSSQVAVPPAYAVPLVRYCLTCYRRLVIDPAGDVIDEQTQEVVDADLLRAEPAPAVLRCSQCEAIVSAFHRRNDEYFGVCDKCDRLVISRAVQAGQ